MQYLILLFVEVLILFLLSRSMSKALSRFMSVNLVALIFLPGVVIHELAHLFMALILFVPVGDMEFAPKKHGDQVKLGSIEVARTDPIRRSLIGFAPAFAGLMLIIGAVYLVSLNFAFFQSQNLYIFILMILILGYWLFAVSNTMFSSSKDMEGTVEVLITLLIFFIGAYILGFRLPLGYLEKLFTGEPFVIIQKSAVFLLVPIAIDLVIFGAIKMFTYRRS